MSFPMSVSGSFRVRKAGTGYDAEKALVRIGDILDAAVATTVTRAGNSVRFTSSMFRFVLNWNVLVPFGSGAVQVEECGDEMTIVYRASTVRMLVIVTAMVSGLAAFIAVNEVRAGQPVGQDVIWPPLLGWGWLFGMNYLIAAVRFPRWLRRGLERGNCLQIVDEQRKREFDPLDFEQ